MVITGKEPHKCSIWKNLWLFFKSQNQTEMNVFQKYYIPLVLGFDYFCRKTTF